MFGILKAIAIAMGAISLAILIKHGAHIQSGPLLAGVLSYYEGDVLHLFIYLQPLIGNLTRWLAYQYHVNIAIGPSWKHIFILVWLLQGSGVIASWRFRGIAVRDTFYSFDRIYSVVGAAIALTIGLPASLLVAVLASSVLNSDASLQNTLLFGAVVIIGMAVANAVIFWSSAIIGVIIGFCKAVLTALTRDEVNSHSAEIGAPENEENDVLLEKISSGFLRSGGLRSFAIGLIVQLTIFALISVYMWAHISPKFLADIGLFSLVGLQMITTARLLVLGMIDATTYRMPGTNYFEALYMNSFFMQGIGIMSTVLSAIGIVLLGTVTK